MKLKKNMKGNKNCEHLYQRACYNNIHCNVLQLIAVLNNEYEN